MPPSDGSRPPQLGALYQELLLDHYRRPRNRGKLEHPDVAISKNNPLCGDVIQLDLQFDGDTVRDLKFTGQGCAISQASASMMTQLLKGKTTAEVEQLARRFTQMIHGDEAAAQDQSLGDLRALAGVARLPVRLKCALLAWGALAEGLAKR
jgi:nitrogen fixation protein NifU and related proteins